MTQPFYFPGKGCHLPAYCWWRLPVEPGGEGGIHPNIFVALKKGTLSGSGRCRYYTTETEAVQDYLHAQAEAFAEATP